IIILSIIIGIRFGKELSKNKLKLIDNDSTSLK
ncbi:unnamed protein product, partial [marine sediment metagenome]